MQHNSSNSADQFIDIRDILSILRRQARLIILTILVALSLAFIHLSRATSMYTASALVMVDTVATNLLDPQTGAPTNASTDTAKLESEVEILRSDSLALKTIQQTQLYLTDEFGPSFGLTDKIKQTLGVATDDLPTGDELLQATLNKFHDSLEVRRRGLTYLINISFTSEDPVRAAEMANQHASIYIDQQVASKVDASLRARDLLQAQLEQARQGLAATDGALADYIENNIERLEAESGSAAVAALRDQLTQSGAQLAAAIDARNAAREALNAGDWASLSAEVADATLTALQEQRDQLARQLEGYERGSAEAIDLTAGLAEIEKQLSAEGQRALSQLDSSVQDFTSSRDSIRDNIRVEVLSADLSAETLSEIYSLQQEAQIAQRQYDNLLQRVREIETQALVQVADSRLMSEALPPRTPSYPNNKLTLALALVAGLGIGIAVAFANEFFFGGVTSANQLANIIPVRVAAVIPRVPMSGNDLTIADRVVDEPMSMLAESFRRLRATIDRQVPDVPGKGKIIMVTSSVPAEGKSSDALALARTYAVAGKRTLLIDADLRKPTQHKFIGAEPAHGLLEYLLGETAGLEGNEFYDADPKSRLGIMMGRRRSNVPTDAPLQSAAFEELLKNAREALDVIIIDTAPLVPVVDARYVAQHVDCVVMCVRYGVTNQSDLRMAHEQLLDSISPDTSLLTVLNAFEGQEKSYRYTGYYGYTSD
mgnify:CR=1 FL=1